MTVATWQDVAVALGRPTSAFNTEQQAQIGHWLNGVELLIVGRLGAVEQLDVATVKYVEAEAVAEKVRRGGEGGASSVSVSVDDATVTRRWENTPVSSSDIWDELWSMLDPTAGDGAYSTRPAFEPDTSPQDTWVTTTEPAP